MKNEKDLKPAAALVVLAVLFLGLRRLLSGKFGEFGQVGFIRNKNEFHRLAQIWENRDSPYFSDLKRYKVPRGTYLRPIINAPRNVQQIITCGSDVEEQTFVYVLSNGVQVDEVAVRSGKLAAISQKGTVVCVTPDGGGSGKTTDIYEVLDLREIQFLEQ